VPSQPRLNAETLVTVTRSIHLKRFCRQRRLKDYHTNSCRTIRS